VHFIEPESVLFGILFEYVLLRYKRRDTYLSSRGSSLSNDVLLHCERDHGVSGDSSLVPGSHQHIPL